MKRAIRIVYKDRTTKDLEIAKATAIKADLGMLHLDKIKDDKWRLTFTEEISDEFSKIDHFDIVRED